MDRWGGHPRLAPLYIGGNQPALDRCLWLSCLFLRRQPLLPALSPPPWLAETVPIRPFKHNEYERFIVQVGTLH